MPGSSTPLKGRERRVVDDSISRRRPPGAMRSFFQIWDLENRTSGLLLNVYRQDMPEVTRFESWQFTPGDIGSN